jgi:hypothetical protein
MGTHFSGLSLKKWSPGRAALGGFWGCSKSLVLRGWSAGTGLSGVFMIHKFKVLPFSCITPKQLGSDSNCFGVEQLEATNQATSACRT